MTVLQRKTNNWLETTSRDETYIVEDENYIVGDEDDLGRNLIELLIGDPLLTLLKYYTGDSSITKKNTGTATVRRIG